jgi:hypothetical protein
MTTRYQLRWVFTNSHEWVKSFDSQEEAVAHALMCGLYNHPDVVEVEIRVCPYSQPSIKHRELKASTPLS